MIYDRVLKTEIDYQTYRFGRSNQLFRGPKPDLSHPYVAVVGSSEVYGKFVPKPFSALLQDKLGITVANYSAVNGGIDLVLKDAGIQAACSKAQAVVLTVMGAHNMSNRLYRVHPRNNDRFIRISKVMRLLFPDVDFADIHYTRHLLNSLRHADLDRFSIVMAEMKKAWVARMTSLITQIDTQVILLWMANQPPKDPVQVPWTGELGPDPLFVDQQMLDAISPQVSSVVEVIASPKAQRRGQKGMVFRYANKDAAEKMLGPAVHKEAAEAMLAPLKALL